MDTINETNEYRQTIGHLLAKSSAYDESDRYRLFKILIQSGFDVSAKDRDGNTILHYLCNRLPKSDDKSRGKLISLLIKNGLNPNEPEDIDGSAALHFLAFSIKRMKKDQVNSVTNMITSLVKGGAKLRLNDRLGNQPQYYLNGKAPDKIKCLFNPPSLKPPKKYVESMGYKKQVRFRNQ